MKAPHMFIPSRGDAPSAVYRSTYPSESVRKQLPNFFSLVRLAVTPPLLVAAMAAGSRSWFFGFLCVAWLTDALDGFLARRLHAESERGRMLDSWADYVTTALCITGLCWLWPEVVRREWPWLVLGSAGFFGIVIYGLVRCGRPPGYHTWLAKALAVALPFALASLLSAWSSSPFHCVMGLQVLGAAEELTIFLLLPGFSGEMPTAWHAWRRRQAGTTTQNLPR